MTKDEVPWQRDNTSSRDQVPMPAAALVIDDDETMTSLLRDYLEDLGIPDISVALDGHSAWELIGQKSFGLLVLDWKLPKISGVTLFNRIRQLPQYETTPICISSGLLTRDDCFLLEEYPLTVLLPKPYPEATLIECVRRLSREALWQTSNVAAIRDLVQDVPSKENLSELNEMLRRTPNPVPLTINAARVFRERGHSFEAELLLRKTAERSPNSILLLAELGKVLFRQRTFDDAYTILTKAQRLSPKNLHRHCLLGEIELVRGNGESAEKHFNDALAIDQECQRAKGGLLSARNLTSLSSEQRIDSPMQKSMAGLMNIIAISLMKKNQYERAIEQYEVAFHFLDDDFDKARIAFNLGLAHLRWQHPLDAKDWFQKSLAFSKGRFEKARAYLDRMNTGTQGMAAKTEADQNDEYVEFLPS